MYGTYGIISLLPVLTLIVVALITKRTFESLLVATLLALIIGYKGYWFSALWSSFRWLLRKISGCFW